MAVCLITLVNGKVVPERIAGRLLKQTAQFGKTLSITIQDVGSTRGEEFENEFKNVTLLANLDANLYANDGTLITTSQPRFLRINCCPVSGSGRIPQNEEGRGIICGDRSRGSLEFYVAYSKVLAPETGEVLGILGIPFFNPVHRSNRCR